MFAYITSRFTASIVPARGESAPTPCETATDRSRDRRRQRSRMDDLRSGSNRSIERRSRRGAQTSRRDRLRPRTRRAIEREASVCWKTRPRELSRRRQAPVGQSSKCTRVDALGLRVGWHEALQLLVEVLDDDQTRRWCRRFGSGALFDHQKPPPIRCDVVAPPLQGEAAPVEAPSFLEDLRGRRRGPRRPAHHAGISPPPVDTCQRPAATSGNGRT